MLRIVNLEEIRDLIRRVPDLVDLQEKRDPDFVPDVKMWLILLEKTLENNRMQVVGNVASLRGILISSERGVIPEGIEFQGRSSTRKIKEATAAHVLRQVTDLVSSVIQKDIDRLIDAERLGRQLVALAKAKGLIGEDAIAATHTERLKVIWQTLSADPDIGPGTVNIEGLVGPHDALIVLDRTIASDAS